MDAVTQIPAIENEPNRLYEPGSPHRVSLQARLAQLQSQAPSNCRCASTDSGRWPAAPRSKVVQPHAHARQLGTTKNATRKGRGGGGGGGEKPHRRGGRCPSTTVRRFCSRPQTCSPDRGATR